MISALLMICGVVGTLTGIVSFFFNPDKIKISTKVLFVIISLFIGIIGLLSNDDKTIPDSITPPSSVPPASSEDTSSYDYSNMNSTDRELYRQKEEFDRLAEKERGTFQIMAIGNFSEGLAYAKISGPCYQEGYKDHYGYINAKGEVVFYLPEELKYGYDFHEGYAVISNHPQYADMPSGYIEGWTTDYALVDKRGDLIIEPGKYKYIGRFSEGLMLTAYVKKDYNGTEFKLSYRDIHENVIFDIDTDAKNIGNLKKTYFHNGIADIQIGSYGHYCLNKHGDIVYKYTSSSFQREQYLSDITDYFATSSKNVIEIFDRTSGNLSEHKINGQIYSIPFKFVGEINIASKKDGGLIVINKDGNIIANNEELHVRHIYPTDQQLWIVELQNDYYGIIDNTASLLFEPIQEKISYAGEGLFYLKNKNIIIDSSGKTVLKLDNYNVDRLGEPFSDGISIVYTNYDVNFPMYMDKNGTTLRLASLAENQKIVGQNENY